MNLKEVHKVYMLGIGGIGMSALARYFKGLGKEVSGYDKTPSPLTSQLIEEGIDIHFDENPSNTKLDADLLIYTPAIPKAHKELVEGQARGLRWYKRSEVLQEITDHHHTLAIAGTHGKTTTSAMLSHLLFDAGINMAGFVGGIMSNYDSNFVCSQSVDFVVAEADEYDRSFQRLCPEIAIITSLDPDHLDIYGTFETMIQDFQEFADSVQNLLIVHESIADRIQHKNRRTYGTGSACDYRLSEVEVVDGKFGFKVTSKPQVDQVLKLETSLPGKHNAENATAALAVALELGVAPDALESAVRGFKGVKRRFERIFHTEDCVLIDDYAHHPIEIEAAIAAARMLFPQRKISVVFQPHLFSRTRDLEDGFSSSLALADELLLLPIYPAREEPIPGVSSDHLLNKVALKTKALVQKTDVVNTVLSLRPDIVLVLGAGDVDRLVQPLATALKSAHHVE